MKLKPIEPNEKQISNCKRWGWEYIGDGLFVKNELIGFFTENGWRTDD